MSSLRMVSIFLHAAFWASTPMAAWNSLKSASNSAEEYCDEFQTPLVLNAALRYTSGVAAVAVVDDAELGGAGARRVLRLGRAPLRAIERVEALDGQGQVEPGVLRVALDEHGEIRDLEQLAGVQRRLDVGGAGTASSDLAFSTSRVRCGTLSSKYG